MIASAYHALIAMTALAANPAADGYDRTETTRVARVEGRYVPMILQALSHPKMRGKRLDCYEVIVKRQEGEWRVYFAGHREPRPPDTETEIYVGNMPQNPQCPDIGFIFDSTGRIAKVYGSRD